MGNVNLKLGPAIDEDPFAVAPIDLSGYGPVIEEDPFAPLPEPEERGLLKTVGAGLVHGTLGIAESAGTGAQWLGNRLGIEPIVEAGEAVSEYFGEKAELFGPSKAIAGKNVWDNPELLADSEWWLYNVADMVPWLAAAVIPGTGTAKAMSLIPKLAKFAQLGGAVSGGFLVGGGMEAAQTYKAVLEKGGTEEQAARSSELMWVGAGALNAFGLGKVLSKAGATFKTRVLKHLGAAAWEGLTEAAEEPTEVFAKYFGAYLSDQPLPDDLKEQLIESAKAALTVAPIAGVVGGGASVISGRGEIAPVTPEPLPVPADEPGLLKIAGAETPDDAIEAFEETVQVPSTAEEAARTLVGGKVVDDAKAREIMEKYGIPIPPLADKSAEEAAGVFVEEQDKAQAEQIVKDFEARPRVYEAPPTEPPARGLLVPEEPEKIEPKLPTAPEIDAAADEAATSPKSDLPEPTQAQKEAGNYKKAHITLHGLQIAIENPRGSERSGVDRSGREWSITMENHYGYFNRTEGKDGDQIDVFIGPDVGSKVAHIVDQVDPETGEFDEHKTLIGFRNKIRARAGYLANYEKGWNGLGAITEVPIDEFKEWIGDGTRKTEAYSKEVIPDAVQRKEEERKGKGEIGEVEKPPETLAKELDLEFIGESDGVSTFRRVVDGKETTTSVQGEVTAETLKSAIDVQDKELADFKEKFEKPPAKVPKAVEKPDELEPLTPEEIEATTSETAIAESEDLLSRELKLNGEGPVADALRKSLAALKKRAKPIEKPPVEAPKEVPDIVPKKGTITKEARTFSMENGRVQVEIIPPYEVGGKAQQVFKVNGETVIGLDELKKKYLPVYEKIIADYPGLKPTPAPKAADVADEGVGVEPGDPNKITRDRIEKKYSAILAEPELEYEAITGDLGDVINKIDDGTATPEDISKYLQKPLKDDIRKESIGKIRSAIADNLGDLQEIYRYESFEEGQTNEKYIDSLLEAVERHSVPSAIPGGRVLPGIPEAEIEAAKKPTELPDDRRIEPSVVKKAEKPSPPEPTPPKEPKPAVVPEAEGKEPTVEDNLDLSELGSMDRLAKIRERFPDLSATEAIKLSQRIEETATGVVGVAPKGSKYIEPRKDQIRIEEPIGPKESRERRRAERDRKKAKAKPPIEITGAKGMIDTIKGEKGSITIDSAHFQPLVDYSRNIYNQGFDTFKKFKAELKRQLGDVWDRIKHLVLKLYYLAKRPLKPGRETGLIGGGKAKTADVPALSRAIAMESEGKDMEAIRKKTGWYLWHDKKWRFEIDDSKATFKPPGWNKYLGKKLTKKQSEKLKDLSDRKYYGEEKLSKKEQSLLARYKAIDKKSVKLKDVISHPDLFKAYPEAQNIRIGNISTPGGYIALQSDIISGGLIEIPVFMEKTRLLPILIHEIQHRIQKIESFARGSDIFDADYNRSAGEIEARAAAERMDLTPEQRKARAPFKDGIPKEDVIVRFHKGTQFATTAIGGKAEPKPAEPSPYEQGKDDWFGNKDWAVKVNEVEAGNIQDSIKAALGKKRYDKEAKDIDQAIHIYLDTKRNPEHFDEYYNDLTPEQKRIADLSKTIEGNPELKAVADYIDTEYKKIGRLALEEGVIFNVIDNYVSRAWKKDKKLSTDILQKFKTKSRHAKHRVFETILEGQSKGLELEITGATNNLNILKDEIARVVEDRKLLKQMEGMTYRDTGAPLISDIPLEGYLKIEHPNFTRWFPKAYIKGGEVSPVYGGSNIRIQKRFAVEKEGAKRAVKVFDSKDEAKNYIGTLEDSGSYKILERNQIWERRNLYAPEEVAKSLNKILGVSKLKGQPGIDTLTKYNAVFKAWILQTSFFHHLAFMRSYLLGTRHKSLKEWNINSARKAGLKAVKELRPEIELLVRNGLTLGKMQDWAEDILRSEETVFGKVMDKMGPVPKAIKDKINDLRERQATFLFGNFGAGLKAQAALIEYRNALKEHPEMDPKDRAKMVANLINDDFGGLHLGRLERNPTTQHIFRLLALAPDWTESNVRTLVKAFKAGGAEETALYRRFWASILTKGVTATVLANMLLGMGDDEDAVERFKKAWKAGNFKWLGIDITPIYRALGGKTEARKYFSLFGHFQDPMKFIFHPVRSAHHKGSVVYRTFHEAMAGTDWKGHRFTTIPELLGVDDKGYYLTNTKDHRIGDPKGGKLAGKSVTFGGKKGPIEPGQFASYLVSQAKGVQPIQIQNFMAYLQGEIEGFDAISRSLGIHTASTYSAEEGVEGDWKKHKRRLKEIHAQYVRSETKAAFLKEHRADVVAYKRSGKQQGKLNKYRKIINKLKSREETPSILKRIGQLEGKRTELIKKYLEK